MLLRVGDVFCGAGGLSLGSARARIEAPDGTAWGLRPEWAVDDDPDACSTYALNAAKGGAVDVRCSDVRKVSSDCLPQTDVVMFGFPCNDFSEVGRRRGMRGRFGPLYLEAVRLLRDHQPMAFVAENVAGLRSAHGGKALRQIAHDLTYSGYRVSAHLYKCEEYGLPQTRHRVFLVGLRQDLRRRFRPPAPSGVVVNAREALARPLPPDAANAEPYPVSQGVTARLAAIRPGENIWQAQKRADFPDECRIAESRAQLSLIYRRLDPARPSGTILGSGGGGTLGYHWEEPRPLTNRERARLQGFPDEFRFVGSPSCVRRQIGMAVPPPIAEVIATALLSTLAGLHYEAVEDNVPLESRRKRPGRPLRLEAKTGAERARAYRARTRLARKAAATALCRAAELGLLSDMQEQERTLLKRFVTRTLGTELEASPLPLAAE